MHDDPEMAASCRGLASHDQRRDSFGGGDAVYRSGGGHGLVGAELKVTGNEKGLTTAFGGSAVHT